MSADIDWDRYLNSPRTAAQELGSILHRGELALFVGAGISKELGVPTWHSLARLMARAAKIESKGINRRGFHGDRLAEIFTKVSRSLGPTDFRRCVKEKLYLRWSEKKGNWASDTLVALGSLMSGSNRGRVDTVLSLNFDSIIEMYLRLYGFVAQPIAGFPCLLRRADVRIFHSHGYLPFDSEDGSDTEILLSKQTYLEAMGEIDSPGRRMMEYVFGQRRILAIGVSGDDSYSRATLAAIAKRSVSPLLGFWIVGPNTPSDRVDELRDSKIAAVRLGSFDDLPEFLFSIARNASAKLGF